jgi:hypothetical protein
MERMKLLFPEKFYNIKTKENLVELMNSYKWEHYKKCIKHGTTEELQKIYNISKDDK